MGTETTRLKLYKPTIGERNYGEEVNANFDTLDTLASRVTDVTDAEFGATGDGTTDDTVAIQAAIDAVNATGGGIVFFPAGTYLISSSLLGYSHVNLLGVGREIVKLQASSSLSDFVIKYTGGGTTGTAKRRFSIKNMTIFGDDQANPLGGIELDWCYIVTMKHVYVRAFANSSAIGFHIRDCFNVIHKSCQANLGGTGTPQGETGFKVSGDVSGGQNITQITWDDCLAQYNGIGIYISDLDTNGDGFTIRQCGIGNNDTKGISIGKRVLNTRIELNHIEHHDDSGDYGIYLSSGISEGIRNVEILNNFFWDDETAIYTNNADRVRIENNTFNGNAVGGGEPSNRYVLDLNSTNRINFGDNVIYSTAYNVTSAPGGIDPRLESFINTDTTPSVASGGLEKQSCFQTVNTSATIITDFNSGLLGQSIKVLITDANTTIDFTGTNLKGNGGVDWHANSNDSMACYYSGTIWYCDIAKTETTIQTLTGAGAVDIIHEITHIVTTGVDALTLADGVEGQRKWIVMKTDANDGTLTPDNLGNGTTITFDDVGDSADLLFTNSAWHMMGGTATLA